jgi:polyisoprenoid-binding protein YceI
MTTTTSVTGDYTLDMSHSTIGFTARHAMVTKVRGRFADVTGSGHFDVDDPAQSRVEVVIQAKSIDTGNADRDNHLRSNDFLAMDEFPEIRFTSTPVPPRTPSATSASASRAARRSTARTGASTGTPRWRRAASWWARR